MVMNKRERKARLEAFIEERDAVMLSLDEERIKGYCEKYQVPVASNDIAFWGGVHKARLLISGITDEQAQISRCWLKEHGFKEIEGSDPMRDMLER